MHIHARGIGGSSFGDSIFVGFEFHIIIMRFFEFFECSRVVSVNLESQEDLGRSSGGPSPHNIHARGIRGASPRISSFDRLELHLIRAFRRARSDR